MTHFAGRHGTASAISSGLIRRNVFSAGHGLAGSRLVASDLFRATHFIAGHTIAMAGRRNANLGWRRRFGSGLTEGLKHFCAQIFGSGDGATGACLVSGGFHRTIGLGASHGLTGGCCAFANLPMGIGSSGLFCTMAIGATGSRDTSALLVASASLGTQFAHLLS